MTDENNIHTLPVKKKTVADAPLTVVQGFGGCQHFRTVVDEKKAEVVCADCGEKLNPIWVLSRLANEDRILRDRWATMKADLHYMAQRRRYKCRGCGQMNNVESSASSQQVFELAEKIKRGEEP